MSLRSIRRVRAAAPIAGVCCAATLLGAAAAPTPDARQIDLAKSFDTRSPWRLVVTAGPPTEDYGGNPAPGALRLCLEKAPGGACISGPVAPPPTAAASVDWGPHYLKAAIPVYPLGRAAAPLLQIVTASLSAGDGGQAVVTQVLKYVRASDAFERIYVHSTGTNNNQEVRFIADGPLRGAVISAEPASDRPYGYWMTVNRFTPARTYRQVLKYRSATLYNDGDTLAVIDSEMPNIERRLGLWARGSPLPLPTGGTKACPRPTLKHMELWCG